MRAGKSLLQIRSWDGKHSLTSLAVFPSKPLKNILISVMPDNFTINVKSQLYALLCTWIVLYIDFSISSTYREWDLARSRLHNLSLTLDSIFNLFYHRMLRRLFAWKVISVFIASQFSIIFVESRLRPFIVDADSSLSSLFSWSSHPPLMNCICIRKEVKYNFLIF